MLKRWISRAVWGAAVGALVAAKDALSNGQMTRGGLLTAVLAAALGAIARSIQDYEPWNGEPRRAEDLHVVVEKDAPKPEVAIVSVVPDGGAPPNPNDMSQIGH